MDIPLEVRKWLSRARDALLAGVVWAAAWAPVGVLIGLIVDPDGSMDEMWVAIGAYPGFLSGMVFSVITGFSKGRRRFDDLQFGWVAVRGAGSGMLVGAVPFLALLPSESASSQGGISGVLVMASITLLGAISAAGSLAVAKWRRGKARSASVPT